MKKNILILTFFCCGLLFSQQNKFDQNIKTPRNIDFKGCVKKITTTTYALNKKNNKIDTTKATAEINFSKSGKIIYAKKYEPPIYNFWEIMEYDNLGRIKTISIEKDDEILNCVNQYFSSKSNFPDSTVIHSIFSNEKFEEKYINHFENNLVVKQDHYINGSLKDYRKYKYNDNNQLIEDLYTAPENDSDKTVVFKGENQMTFYPVRLTLYEYKKIKDTLISIKIRPKYNLKEVTKNLKTKRYSLEIKEEYDNDFLESSILKYTYKNSTISYLYYYNKKKEIRDYSIYTNTKNSMTSKSKSHNSLNNQEHTETTKIDIAYDKFKNWIRKVYSTANENYKIIERKIEYY